MTTTTISIDFPSLPLVCLETATELTTHQVVKGKNCVIGKQTRNKRAPNQWSILLFSPPLTQTYLFITFVCLDFWTTRCTRCPAALDKINAMAADPKYGQSIHFMSICCDSLDGAREIIEELDQRRWPNLRHYFMSPDDKEKAKRILGFQAVPFYVMLDERGDITQMGNKVDFERLPGMDLFSEKENEVEPGYVNVKNVVDTPTVEDCVFVLDDLDF
jgi:hypothetical protein